MPLVLLKQTDGSN